MYYCKLGSTQADDYTTRHQLCQIIVTTIFSAEPYSNTIDFDPSLLVVAYSLVSQTVVYGQKCFKDFVVAQTGLPNILELKAKVFKGKKEVRKNQDYLGIGV